MSPRLRKIIFYLFLLMFLISSAWIVLLATGYAIEWKHLTLVKTGLILVDATPKQAEISLNNEYFASKSPARITRLLPQDYLITIAKPGYIPWTKSVTVQAGQTALLSPVFPLPAPAITKLSSIPPHASAILSPSATLLAVASPAPSPELSLYTQTGTITPLFRPLSTGNIGLVSWSPAGTAIIFTYPSPENYSIIRLSDRSVVSINALTGSQPSTIIWHPIYDGYFYYLSDRTLYAYDSVHTRKKQVLENIDSVIEGPQGILATRKGETIHEFMYIPFSDETPRSILSGGRGMYAAGLNEQYFWTTENGNIYMYPFFEKPEAILSAPGSHALVQYTDTASTLISWDDIEMHRTPVSESSRQTLLTRLGSRILSARIMEGYPYVLAETDTALIAISTGSVRPDAPSTIGTGRILSWSASSNTALVQNNTDEYSLLVFPTEIRR